jgi:hypothetical protein
VRPNTTRFPTDFEGGREPFVPLDSVGGCTTLVKADVHREGALFAPNYLIGARWGADGHDGIESEGARAGTEGWELLASRSRPWAAGLLGAAPRRG